MAPECSRAATLESEKYQPLLGGQGAAVPQRVAMGARDIADLHAWPLTLRVGAQKCCEHGLLAQDVALLSAEQVERAAQTLTSRLAQVGVASGTLQIAVAEQHLHRAQVGADF